MDRSPWLGFQPGTRLLGARKATGPQGVSVALRPERIGDRRFTKLSIRTSPPRGCRRLYVEMVAVPHVLPACAVDLLFAIAPPTGSAPEIKLISGGPLNLVSLASSDELKSVLKPMRCGARSSHPQPCFRRRTNAAFK